MTSAPQQPSDRPEHPTVKAIVVLAGALVVVVLLAVISTFAGGG